MMRFLIILSLAGSAFAQSGQITGLVSDPAGAAVGGAKVTITNEETRIARDTVTNEQGYYTFPLLNPGSYELGVQKPGFKGVTRPGITLNVAQIARVDLSLQLGEV